MKIKRGLTSYRKEGIGIDYEQFSPTEVASLSRTGVALGYDPFRWGERFEKEHGSGLVARATQLAINMSNWSIEESSYLYDNDSGGSYALRREYIRGKKWVPWSCLSPVDESFALSLVWVPEEPVSALEALARLD